MCSEPFLPLRTRTALSSTPRRTSLLWRPRGLTSS
ncbi:unnamed protein product [Oppiella nova]|uniref:Uncharacterized protein n=1 Tax=Oppiella nova TaxID=334625 RepID=A0A7R9MQH3_9ACAR|nr:unnamed protein product [Oppiella nova]CAG2181483.1 unnamed protein product [Oppiella nova]